MAGQGRQRRVNDQRSNEFEDMLPVMASRLGGEGLIKELCNGFKLLMDKDKGVITMESLKRNAAVLGLDGMGDEELCSMVREGDIDGDGALSEMEFCVLMFRLSPELMEASEYWLEETLDLELRMSPPLAGLWHQRLPVAEWYQVSVDNGLVVQPECFSGLMKLS